MKLDDYKSFYEIIKYQQIDIIEPQKIARLEKCFNYNNIEDKNYFLICSFARNRAIIVSASNDYKIDLIQKIDIDKGLYFSQEFQYKDDYYLLNSNNTGFSIWYYDKISQNLKNNIIEQKFEENE